MNLLTDPLLPAVVDGEVVPLDLPTLLARYARDQVQGLPFLRPHQQAPWHMFCVQLAALALHRAGSAAIVDDADRWRRLLRGLTPDWSDDAPWRLVAADPTRPAFMQPPIPKGASDPHKTPVATPDDLDVLVTSKNHGVKQAQADDAPPAAWIAALVALQTTGGFHGAGNYGVARMNGGFATRPCIGLVPPGGPGVRWRRDVTVLLRRRGWCFERVEDFAEASGAALLWCLPWDGAESLSLAKLDPWFIEVCRRVRLAQDDRGRILARTAVSTATRVAAKECHGNVGDPWIPIDLRKGSAAYNTAPRYPVVSGVLFKRSDWIRPLLLEWHRGIDPPVMIARFDVLVRGQGTTEGHHVREVPFEGERRLSMLMLDQERDRAAELAEEMIGHARDLRLKVLKPPLLALAQAGAEEVNFLNGTTSAWVEPYLQQVDEAIEPVFFDHLFARAEQGAEADQAWVRHLRRIAKGIFKDAVAAVPAAGARRLKAIAVAEQRLDGAFRRTFEGYLKEPEAEHVG